MHTLVIGVAYHHNDGSICSALQVSIRSRCDKLNVHNFYRLLFRGLQGSDLIFNGRTGGEGEVLHKCSRFVRRINTKVIHTNHIQFCLHIAVGNNLYTGNILQEALIEGQFNHIAGLNCRILLVCNVDILGGEFLRCAGSRGVTQRNRKISVFRNKVCSLCIIAQGNENALLSDIGISCVVGNCVEFHLRIPVLTIQIEGIDYNTSTNLLYDCMVHIGIHHIVGLCLHMESIQRTHAGGCQTVDRVNRLSFCVRTFGKIFRTCLQNSSVCIRILCAHIKFKYAGNILCRIYENIEGVISGVRNAGYCTDPCVILCIQFNGFVLGKIDFLINITAGRQEQIKRRNLIHSIFTQILRFSLTHIFILLIDQQRACFHDQRCRNIGDLQRTAVQALGIQCELTKSCHIGNAYNKPIRMIFPEHKAVIRNCQGHTGAACCSIIQINWSSVGIIIHSADYIEGKLIPLAVCIVVFQSAFHGAIECTATTAGIICAGTHAEFQIQRIGTVSDRIDTGNIRFHTALLTGNGAACALITIVNANPAYVLHDPFLRDAAIVIPANPDLGNVQLIIRIAFLRNIIGDDMNRDQITVVIVGRYHKALRASRPEAVSTQLLVCQHIAADTVFKLQQEIESVFRAIVAITIQQRSGSALNLNFHRIVLTGFCQTQVGCTLLIAHGIEEVSPVIVIHFLNTLRDEINLIIAAWLDQRNFIHREDNAALYFAVISTVRGSMFGNHIFPNAKTLTELVYTSDPEACHLPVRASFGYGNFQAGKMFHLRNFHNKGNTCFSIDLSGIGKIRPGSRPISIEVLCTVAHTEYIRFPCVLCHVHVLQRNLNIIGYALNLCVICKQFNQIFFSLLAGFQHRAFFVRTHGYIMAAVSRNGFTFYGGRCMIE